MKAPKLPNQQSPTVVPLALRTPFETTLTAQLPDIRNGEELNIDTQLAVGAVSLSDNNLTYTPAPGFSGTDSFPYTVINPFGSSTSQISISVRAPEDPAPD